MEHLIDLSKLSKYMKDNNISELELAKKLGVDYTTVYRVFRGSRKPGAKFVTGLFKSDIDTKFFLSTDCQQAIR